MRKILILLLMMSVPTICCAKSFIDEQLEEVDNNLKYNTVNVHERNYQLEKLNFSINSPKDLKDPKIINFINYDNISDDDYEKKLAQDEAYYKS